MTTHAPSQYVISNPQEFAKLIEVVHQRGWDEFSMIRDPARRSGMIRLGSQVNRTFAVVRYMPRLVEQLCGATDLRWLSCVGYGIDDDGACAIANNLHDLAGLHAWSNRIGARGAFAIAQKLTLLTSLNLGGNAIGTDGVQAIAAN